MLYESGSSRRTERMRLRASLLTLFCMMLYADKQPVASPTAKPVGPYSPGILTRDFLYVSGQGAKNAEGQIPPDREGQLRQCFENVKSIVQAAGLSMENVVYTQVYLTEST